MLNEKVMIIILTVGFVKKTLYKWVDVFLKLKPWWENVKVELDLSNYAAKSDVKKWNRCW